MSDAPGVFVSIDGPKGAGKTTVLAQVKAMLMLSIPKV